MSQADLPLNPKEQKAKNKIEGIYERVKEAKERVREEREVISKEKRFEAELMKEISKVEVSKEESEEFIVGINKWYTLNVISSIRKMSKIENEIKNTF